MAADSGIACLPRDAVTQMLERGWLVDMRTRLRKTSRRLPVVIHRDKKLGACTAALVAACGLAPRPLNANGRRQWRPASGPQDDLRRRASALIEIDEGLRAFVEPTLLDP